MNELIFVAEESEEGGFTAKSLTESIFTQAKTPDELNTMVKEAICCHFGGNNYVKYLLVTS